MDRIDKKILAILQVDATIAVARIAARVGLSTTPCWRRIQKLDEDGVVVRRVAIIDPEKIGLSVSVFVSVSLASHQPASLTSLPALLASSSEIVECHRMGGDIDYLMRVVVRSVDGYTTVHNRIIEAFPGARVSANFSMQRLKQTTELPLDQMKVSR